MVCPAAIQVCQNRGRMPSREQIEDALRKVIDPELRKDIVSLGMVRSIEQPEEGRGRRRRLADHAGLPDPRPLPEGRRRECPGPRRRACQRRLRRALRPRRSRRSSSASAARAGLPQGALAAVKNVICIGSGKGGVGKSTVTANLAAALQAEGKQAAAMDADVWGYSIPRMLGVHGRPRGLGGAQDPAARRRRRREGDLDRVLPQRARTRRSPGAARCCTRRSASSSRTSTGASSTTC